MLLHLSTQTRFLNEAGSILGEEHLFFHRCSAWRIGSLISSFQSRYDLHVVKVTCVAGFGHGKIPNVLTRTKEKSMEELMLYIGTLIVIIAIMVVLFMED